eukprot:SM000270S10372  [mRNA]  locus=s270:104390:109074:- [translate_table: standard]
MATFSTAARATSGAGSPRSPGTVRRPASPSAGAGAGAGEHSAKPQPPSPRSRLSPRSPSGRPVPSKEKEELTKEKLQALQDQVLDLQKENAGLKAAHAEVGVLPEDYSNERFRLLQEQNLHLEHKLALAEAIRLQAAILKDEMLAAVKTVQARLAELKGAEHVKTSRGLVTTLHSPRTSSLSTSSSEASSTMARTSPATRNLSPASVQSKVVASKEAPSPTARTTAAPSVTSSGRRLSLVERQAMQKPSSKSPPVAAVQPPAGKTPPKLGPRVVVDVEWLEGLGDWAGNVQERLSLLTAPSVQGTQEQLEVSKGGSHITLAIPFLATGRQQMATQPLSHVNKEDLQPLAVKLARVYEEPLLVLDYQDVMSLEGTLGNLQPRMLKLDGIVNSTLLPSLADETYKSVQLEVASISKEISEAARSLGSLMSLLPGRARLANHLSTTSTDLESEAGTSGITRQGLEGTEALRQAERNGTVNGLSPSTSSVPSLEELLVDWPSPDQPSPEIQGRLEKILERLRHVVAAWASKDTSKDSELSFYRKCHQAQASAKVLLSFAEQALKVMQLGRSVLPTIFADAARTTGAAAQAIDDVLDVLEHLPTSPTEQDLRLLLTQLEPKIPTIRSFLALLPAPQQLAAVDSKQLAEAALDPVEISYREQIQSVFDGLQSERSALFRSQSRTRPELTSGE